MNFEVLSFVTFCVGNLAEELEMEWKEFKNNESQ